jgi:hypothetical protein
VLAIQTMGAMPCRSYVFAKLRRRLGFQFREVERGSEGARRPSRHARVHAPRWSCLHAFDRARARDRDSISDRALFSLSNIAALLPKCAQPPPLPRRSDCWPAVIVLPQTAYSALFAEASQARTLPPVSLEAAVRRFAGRYRREV